MTKQEKIRAGVTVIIDDCEEPDGVDGNRAVAQIFSYLHSQGVVIKVSCPHCAFLGFKDGESVGMAPCLACHSTGYIYEPLIKEPG